MNMDYQLVCCHMIANTMLRSVKWHTGEQQSMGMLKQSFTLSIDREFCHSPIEIKVTYNFVNWQLVK